MIASIFEIILLLGFYKVSRVFSETSDEELEIIKRKRPQKMNNVISS